MGQERRVRQEQRLHAQELSKKLQYMQRYCKNFTKIRFFSFMISLKMRALKKKSQNPIWYGKTELPKKTNEMLNLGLAVFACSVYI